ncbi:hypothetical protein [Aggregatilinea lenta]|uniref:hypothetical protein n=1 Tax=Aggregatilinea lenta TaxID=913108 RepID=UPI000E5A8784|nr:hypothetical protein [Aggregatilinea lenta]
MHSICVVDNDPLSQGPRTLLIHGEAGTIELPLRDAYLDELATLLELSSSGFIYEEGNFLVSVFYEQGLVVWHAMGWGAKDITFTTHTQSELVELATFLRQHSR